MTPEGCIMIISIGCMLKICGLRTISTELDPYPQSSILIYVVPSPQFFRMCPMLLIVTPFPSPLTTPPVSMMYFTGRGSLWPSNWLYMSRLDRCHCCDKSRPRPCFTVAKKVFDFMATHSSSTVSYVLHRGDRSTRLMSY